jgi:hypothetical protein
MTVPASFGNIGMFDQAGDIGMWSFTLALDDRKSERVRKLVSVYVPLLFGHYVENIGNTTLKCLEISKTDMYQDISFNQ